ncbi:MAG TPA: MoxR family ATPase [Candidatus Methylacidiphilales bacterium]|nr:MoxR family ATPase [Candidatus Methylacidiphilales bacterium]
MSQSFAPQHMPAAGPPHRSVGGPPVNIQAINEAVARASGWVRPMQQQMARVIVGQRDLVERLIVGVVANGHVLLEGVPGLAKTLALKTLAQCMQVRFQRIQFTPDMLPADIVGTLVYNPVEGTFNTKHGPIFSNMVLADEINRAPAKVQSALLEAMQERQVTLGDQTFRLPDPFLVLATQNPVEQEGTYALPEAQVDRFMLKIVIHYPSRSEERSILDSMGTSSPLLEVSPVIGPEEVIRSRQVVNSIYIDDKVKDYIVDIVLATRDPRTYRLDFQNLIQYGASPRATIALTLASKAYAFIHGRGYVTPQDVKAIAPDVLRHRVIVTYEAEAENLSSNDIIQQILDTLPVP